MSGNSVPSTLSTTRQLADVWQLAGLNYFTASGCFLTVRLAIRVLTSLLQRKTPLLGRNSSLQSPTLLPMTRNKAGCCEAPPYDNRCREEAPGSYNRFRQGRSTYGLQWLRNKPLQTHSKVWHKAMHGNLPPRATIVAASLAASLSLARSTYHCRW
jgi:hypothetical protein